MELLNGEVMIQILESISEGVYLLDAERTIVYWNRGAERITGYSSSEVLGRKCSDYLLRHVDETGRELCIDGCIVAETLTNCSPMDMEMYLHHKDGHRLPILAHTAPILGPEGKAIGAIEIFADRSDRSDLVRELESLKKEALTDPLTNLGNRRFAEICTDSAFRELKAEGLGFGFLILDIDHFKAINDAYGHATGDRVLRMIGWTIANAVRRNDAAARWGGEEFVVICPRIDAQVLAEVAERVRALVARSWIGLDDGRKVAATISVGGAIARAGDTLETLLGRADERLYFCKMSGRNRIAVRD